MSQTKKNTCLVLLLVGVLGVILFRLSPLKMANKKTPYQPVLGNFGEMRSVQTEAATPSIWKVCADRGKVDSKLIPTDVPSSMQLKVMQDLMGSHHHRVAHGLWHTMRGNLTSQEIKTILKAYGKLWKNPHKMCPLPGHTVDSQYNPYGEDFLYMHRDMVNSVQSALIQAGLPCMGSWEYIPDPQNTSWPVPDNDGNGVKSESAYKYMRDWDTAFHDPDWLRIHSLSEVGIYMEVSLHNNMHMRWATRLSPFGASTGAPLPYNGKFPSDWPYDVVSYDWLADTYASHVNKHFWKLHGLVDQTIDRWLDAKGYTEIATDCKGNVKCYQWRGTWIGNPMHNESTQFISQGKGDPRLERSITEKRMKALREGELTVSLLKELEENQKESASPWVNDPEEFVKYYFCN